MQPIKPFFFDIDDEEIAYFIEESARILRSGQLILGEHTRRFENEFADFVGVKHAIAVNSGSSALEFLLRLKNAQGRTVLVPTNTNFATVAAVIRVGGYVKYLDMDKFTFAPVSAWKSFGVDHARRMRCPSGIISSATTGLFAP